MQTTSEIAAAQTEPPFHSVCTPMRPTVEAIVNAPSVAMPKPAVRKADSQCRHRTSNAAMTMPATTLTRKSGPTDWCLTPSNQR